MRDLKILKCLIVHKSRWHTPAGPGSGPWDADSSGPSASSISSALSAGHAMRQGSPEKEKKRPAKSLASGSDTGFVHVVCGCALVPLLLRCFDALI